MGRARRPLVPRTARTIDLAVGERSEGPILRRRDDATLELTSLRELLPGREHVRIVRPDGRSHQVSPTTRVSVIGPPGEVLLFLAGRTDAADVEVAGAAHDIAELRTHLVV